jgi:hypothetical protein
LADLEGKGTVVGERHSTITLENVGELSAGSYILPRLRRNTVWHSL